jgi:hypothetical protein
VRPTTDKSFQPRIELDGMTGLRKNLEGMLIEKLIAVGTLAHIDFQKSNL